MKSARFFFVGRDSYRTGRQFALQSIDLLCTLAYNPLRILINHSLNAGNAKDDI